MSTCVKRDLGAPRVRLPWLWHAGLAVVAWCVDKVLLVVSVFWVFVPWRLLEKLLFSQNSSQKQQQDHSSFNLFNASQAGWPASSSTATATAATTTDTDTTSSTRNRSTPSATTTSFSPPTSPTRAQRCASPTSGLTRHVEIPSAPPQTKAELIILDSQQNVFNNDVQQVFVMVPGNPGHPEFYVDYMGLLHAETKRPCVIIGHTGHSPHTATPHLFSHFHQVEHKVHVMHTLRGRYPNAKFVLLGHSIGAWIALEMLKFLDTDRIHRVINLFPTVHHIGLSLCE